MKLGGFSIPEAANNAFGGSSSTGRAGYSTSESLAAASRGGGPSVGILTAGSFFDHSSSNINMSCGTVMPAPRIIPPSLLPRVQQPRSIYAIPGLSLGLDHLQSGNGFEMAAEARDLVNAGRSMESELAVKPPKDEGYESRSGSDNIEGGSGDEQDPEQARPNKKRYHRHAPAVIQELEAFFKECPHPDEKQRQELSKRLNLATRQVKFWFQNRRTQMKAQQERHENNILRQENERLRAENFTIREAMRNASCPTCGGPTAIDMSLEEQQIRIENARMREELERLYVLCGRLYGNTKHAIPSALPYTPAMAVPSDMNTGAVSSLSIFQGGISRDHGLAMAAGISTAADVLPRPNFLTAVEKNMITELAVVAMEEFTKIVYASEPLWVAHPDTGKETLDFNEYLNRFPRGIGPKPEGYRSEATRDTSLVMLDGVSLVESFFDVSRWMELFPCIIAKADVGEVISSGSPLTRNGALQLMYAELQLPSPMVPTRELYFLRYCKMFGDTTWAIVDVSVDNLRGDSPSAANKYRRRPSGCLIQQMPNGYSKVSWVEHSEFDDVVLHHLYRSLVVSGMAFGAQRWLATLRRQCERQAILMAADPISTRVGGGILLGEDARSGLLKLAQRMTAQLCSSLRASSGPWTTLSTRGDGEEEVRVKTRDTLPSDGYVDLSSSSCGGGLVLSASTSIWLPAPPQRVLDFLSNARKQWDVFSLNGPMDELVNVAKGQEPGNNVSLLRPIKGGGNMLILQECCCDPSGSSLVYAPVDVAHMDAVMSGGGPAGGDSSVPLLPSGFFILPDGPDPSSARPRVASSADHVDSPVKGGSSLVSVAFQILVNGLPKSRLSLESVNTVNTLVCNTVKNIRSSFLSDNANQLNQLSS